MDVPPVGAAAAAGQQQPAQPIAGAAPVQTDTAQTGDRTDEKSLSPVVANLFSGKGQEHHANVNVSYRVESGRIVTVFTDPSTGKEITQVPSELLVQLAQFFDKQSGVTLDKSA